MGQSNNMLNHLQPNILSLSTATIWASSIQIQSGTVIWLPFGEYWRLRKQGVYRVTHHQVYTDLKPSEKGRIPFLHAEVDEGEGRKKRQLQDLTALSSSLVIQKQSFLKPQTATTLQLSIQVEELYIFILKLLLPTYQITSQWVRWSQSPTTAVCFNTRLSHNQISLPRNNLLFQFNLCVEPWQLISPL